jgi:hypothetical protein
MYESKKTPGKKFGSSFVGKRYDDNTQGDSNSDPKESKAPIGMAKPAAGAADKETSRTNDQGEAKFSAAHAEAEPNNVKASPEGVDAGAVAAEHGPASHVTIHHDHKGGKHMVVSRHPSGHMHTSEHGSAPDAHKAAAQLGGEANTENEGSAANEEQMGGGDMFGNDGFKVPHLG